MVTKHAGQVSAITYVGRMGVAGHAYERRLAVKEAPTKPSTPIWPMPAPRKFWWSRSSASPITEPLPMRKRNRHVCVIALLRLTCGCQSNSTPPQLVVTQCKPPPAAWFMELIEPNLTQRMLSELSESPATAIKD